MRAEDQNQDWRWAGEERGYKGRSGTERRENKKDLVGNVIKTFRVWCAAPCFVIAQMQPQTTPK